MNAFFFFIKISLTGLSGQRLSKQIVSDLFNKFSYRYNLAQKGSYKSLLRYFVYAFRLIITRRSKKSNTSEIVVFDGSGASEKSRIEYLESLGHKQLSFISRDNLPNQLSFWSRVGLVIGLFITSIWLFPIWLFRKDRTRLALILLEATECSLIRAHLKSAKSTHVFIFSAYEKEISFLSYFLAKTGGIKVWLFPSPNPIRFYYQTVVCDTFCFSAPFQKIEFEELNINWQVRDTLMVPPPGYTEIEIFHENKETHNIIGFVSSGGHLRKKLQHTNNFEEADFKAEEATLSTLQAIIKKEEYQLIIYLHPIEKRDQKSIDLSIHYYREIFGEQVKFAPFDQPSKRHFSLCNVAVSGFSSAQIERLHGGHKTLFTPMGFLPDYFRDPRLRGISANTQQELLDLIKESLSLSNSDFFAKHRLQEYSHSHLQK